MMLFTGVSASTQHRRKLADLLARWAPGVPGSAGAGFYLLVSVGGRVLAGPGAPGARCAGGSAKFAPRMHGVHEFSEFPRIF